MKKVTGIIAGIIAIVLAAAIVAGVITIVSTAVKAQAWPSYITLAILVYYAWRELYTTFRKLITLAIEAFKADDVG